MPKVHPLPCLGFIAAALWFCPLLAAQTGARINPTSQSQLPVSSIPTPELPIPSALTPDLAAPEAPDSYPIGRQDLLSVFVYQMPDLTRQVRVDSEGDIHLPFVPQKIPVAGATADVLSDRIAATLERDGIARQPMVQVVVRQVMSKPIIVNGEVNQPLTLQAARPLSLLEVLARAGGPSASAGDTVLVTTGLGSDPHLQRISLQQVLEQGAGSQLMLTGEDAVTVLSARLIYVVGDLHKPGAFPLRSGEPVTALKALALSEGANNTASRYKAVIIHTLSDGRRVMNPVNLDNIVSHKIADPVLQAGDILYVPRNGLRVVMGTAIQDAAQTVAIGIGYHW